MHGSGRLISPLLAGRTALARGVAQRTRQQIVSPTISQASVNSATITKPTNDEFESLPVSKHGKHRSDAQQRVQKVPVIEVKDDIAICTGGECTRQHKF
jgi:hypothetical protein